MKKKVNIIKYWIENKFLKLQIERKEILKKLKEGV
jgi:hypothetical protein